MGIRRNYSRSHAGRVRPSLMMTCVSVFPLLSLLLLLLLPLLEGAVLVVVAPHQLLLKVCLIPLVGVGITEEEKEKQKKYRQNVFACGWRLFTSGVSTTSVVHPCRVHDA
jgi:hypothetical protein